MILDYRLKVFQTVAQQLSFTKAAALLFVSQPSVTKHINELEKQIQKPLFIRHGRKISLTHEGNLLLRYANDILFLYEQLNSEFQELQDNFSGDLKIGASTTIAQYILPTILAKFKTTHPQMDLHLWNGNTQDVESKVLEQKVHIGIIEGDASNSLLHYESFVRDEIVLVTRQENPQIKKNKMLSAELSQLPLVIREKGSGTLAVVSHALAGKKIALKNLQIEMELGSSESIKNYLLHSNACAFLSIHTLLEELLRHQLKIIELTDLTIYRNFQFVFPHGQHSSLLNRFQQFCRTHYNRP